jgi:hypothetical protein
MDYLDPDKKRQHKQRLLFGYVLIGFAIGIATVLLVYMANGYYVDRDTGQVIQNGLVYVDSRPGGAEIYLNGEKQKGATDARLVVPAGEYEIGLKRDGYRDWGRNLLLEGGSLRKLTYARLIPNELTSSVGANLRSNPIATSQSIDKKWLVLSFGDKPLELNIIDIEQPTVTPQIITIPSNLVVDSETGTIEITEWADDNRNFIAKYTNGNLINYILVDRENPQAAVNLNILFGDNNYEIGFQDRNKDIFFAYKPATKSLLTASLSGGVNPSPVVDNVYDYKTFGRDWVLYITESGEEGLVSARFKRGDKDILLKKIKTSDKYLLQLAKLGNAPVMGISSTVENRAIVYNDPQKFLDENPEASVPIATTVLRVEKPSDLRISSDSSVIMASGQGKFASHEFEADRSYTFTVEVPVDPIQEVRWLDGQHFLFSSEGKQFMMDFDGSNMYDLVASMPVNGSYFTNNIEIMFSFTPSVTATATTPDLPASITVTNLLAVADR